MGNRYLGPISPSLTKGHRFILAITDYFSKWAEAIPLIEVETSNVVNFIIYHVIHRFGVPRRIIQIMVPNLQAKYSISFALSTIFRIWRQLLITLLLMVWRKHSIRQSSSYSRNSFRQINEIGMRSSVNVFGLTELRFEL